MSHTVQIERAPATTAAVTRFHVSVSEMDTIGDRITQAFQTVIARLGEQDVVSDGPALARYQAEGDGYNVAAGFRVAETFAGAPGVERLELGGEEVAHLTHLGPYSELRESYQRLQDEVAERGRRIADGPMWEEYWSPPDTPDDQTRTEVYWPVAAA